MTLSSPISLLLLLGIPLIIILYLLKQRHQDYTVSSLYLWQVVLRDLEAHAPWQRLKRNLLMFLQITAIVLLAIALSRPFINNFGTKAGSVIIVMDTSFSMQANDVKPSRIEEAKRMAKGLVANLHPGTLVTLVNMSNTAVIVENLSSDRGVLLDKINSLKAEGIVAGVEDTQSLVASIVKQRPGTKVVLFGDQEIEVPGVEVQFANVGKGGDNYALTLLTHRQEPESITALCRIANYSADDIQIPVSLYVNGMVFDTKKVSITKGSSAPVLWSNIPLSAKRLECKIDLRDSLEADNTVWDSINSDRSKKVLLVSEKNVFLEKALSLIQGVKVFRADTKSPNAYKGYDLYVMDGFLPEKLPEDGSLLIFDPPENKAFTVEKELILPVVEKSEHEIFKYINDYSFTISKSKALKVPSWGEEILSSNQGTLGFAGLLKNERMVVFGFDVHKSDIALKTTFPILISNALDYLLPRQVQNIERIYPGESVEFVLDPKAQKAQVRTPNGKSVAIAPPFPPRIFTDTLAAGFYTLQQQLPDTSINHYFCVNVPAEAESNLKAMAAGQGKGVNPSLIAGGILDTGMSLQAFFLWLLLLLLITEWWVYSHGI